MPQGQSLQYTEQVLHTQWDVLLVQRGVDDVIHKLLDIYLG